MGNHSAFVALDVYEENIAIACSPSGQVGQNGGIEEEGFWGHLRRIGNVILLCEHLKAPRPAATLGLSLCGGGRSGAGRGGRCGRRGREGGSRKEIGIGLWTIKRMVRSYIETAVMEISNCAFADG